MNDESMTAAIGARVRAAREATGRTQAECAEHLGITQALWSRLETGDIEWSAEAIARVADFFGLRLDTLVPTRRVRRADHGTPRAA